MFIEVILFLGNVIYVCLILCLGFVIGNWWEVVIVDGGIEKLMLLGRCCYYFGMVRVWWDLYVIIIDSG